jgi:hypothetical protein
MCHCKKQDYFKIVMVILVQYWQKVNSHWAMDLVLILLQALDSLLMKIMANL